MELAIPNIFFFHTFSIQDILEDIALATFANDSALIAVDNNVATVSNKLQKALIKSEGRGD